MPGNCHFNTNWLRNPQYASWLMPCELDEYKAACRVCCRSFEIASMGEAGVKSHMAGKKHTKLIEDLCARNGMESLFTMAMTSTEGTTNTPSTSTLPVVPNSSPFLAQQLKSYYNAPYLQHSYRMRKALTGLDKLLLNWYKGQRNTTLPMSGAVLLEKARELAAECQYETALLNENWIKRFKKRHGITFRATCGIGVGNGNHTDIDANDHDNGQCYQMLSEQGLAIKEEPSNADGNKEEPESPPNDPSSSINDEDSCELPCEMDPETNKETSVQGQSYPAPMMPPMLEFFREPSNKKRDGATNEILRIQRDEHRLTMLVLRQKKVHKHQEHEAKMAEHAASMEVYALQREYWARMLQSVGGGPIPMPAAVPIPSTSEPTENEHEFPNERILP